MDCFYYKQESFTGRVSSQTWGSLNLNSFLPEAVKEGERDLGPLVLDRHEVQSSARSITCARVTLWFSLLSH